MLLLPRVGSLSLYAPAVPEVAMETVPEYLLLPVPVRTSSAERRTSPVTPSTTTCSTEGVWSARTPVNVTSQAVAGREPIASTTRRASVDDTVPSKVRVAVATASARETLAAGSSCSGRCRVSEEPSYEPSSAR